MEARDSFCFPKNTKNPNPSPIGKKFGFCCCGAPPGTRTLGPLIKRNQRATIVDFDNYAASLFLSFYRKFVFCICCIPCTCYPLLHPLSSRSGVQKVCKNVQSQNQHLKTGIGFLCNGVKTGLFHPAKGTLYITNLYHTSNVHQQFDSWQGYGQPIYISLRSRKPRLPTHNFLCQEGWHRPALSLFAKVSVCATTRRISGYCASAPASG